MYRTLGRIQHLFTAISVTKSLKRRARKDKYRPCADVENIVHRGKRVPTGVPELLRHCDKLWFNYLELLARRPQAPNPFEAPAYQDPDLRFGLLRRGYVDLSSDQLIAKSKIYVSKLEAGEDPYTDNELYRSGWINDEGEMIDSQTGEVISFVPVGSAD